MNEPPSASNDALSDAFQCTRCACELAIHPDDDFPKCPRCHNAEWVRLWAPTYDAHLIPRPRAARYLLAQWGYGRLFPGKRASQRSSGSPEPPMEVGVMVALGLVLLVIAAVVALVGIFSNLGNSHHLGRTVDLLGYHLHGSAGKLLLVGVIIGAVGMLGLNMLLAGIGRGFKRSINQRKERRLERHQARNVAQDRDHLAAELEREHAARLQAERETGARQTDAALGDWTTVLDSPRHMTWPRGPTCRQTLRGSSSRVKGLCRPRYCRHPRLDVVSPPRSANCHRRGAVLPALHPAGALPP